ncbi:MAG: InlB B-repeat-containing protein [Candidatus Methanomethylophilaceae archaeon]|nr:InlB B-repeat-containing protein [Candidatus Methanomethylophilaceae archaeon]
MNGGKMIRMLVILSFVVMITASSAVVFSERGTDNVAADESFIHDDSIGIDSLENYSESADPNLPIYYDTGSVDNPLSELSGLLINEFANKVGDYYLANGGAVNIPEFNEDGIRIFAKSVTSGHGISIYNGGLIGTATTNGYVDVVIDATEVGDGSTTKRIYIVDAPVSTYTITLATTGGSGYWTYAYGSEIVSNVTVSEGTTYYTFGYDVYLSDGRVFYSHCSDNTLYVISAISPNTPSDTAITSDLTITVTISQRPTVVYQLSYSANGGSGAPETQKSPSVTLTSYSFTVPSTTPIKAGYKFSGWSFDSNASSSSYVGGDSVTLSSSNPSRTLYAVWQVDSTVNFYTVSFAVSPSDAGRVTSTSISVPEGTSISDSGSTLTFRKSGMTDKIVTAIPNDDNSQYSYQFSHWSLTSGTITSNTSIVAHINVIDKIDTFYVDFNAEGGSSCDRMEAHPSITLPTTVKNNYTFDGWYLGTQLVGDAGDTYTPSGDVTLVAHWTPNTSTTITVQFITNGGSECAPIEATTESPEIKLPSTTKSDSSFMGWFTESTGGTRVGGAGDKYTPESNIILYAHWSTWTVTIKQYLGDYTFTAKFYLNGVEQSNITGSFIWKLDGVQIQGGSQIKCQLQETPSQGEHIISLTATINNSTAGAITDELNFTVDPVTPEPDPEPETKSDDNTMIMVVVGVVIGILALFGITRVI